MIVVQFVKICFIWFWTNVCGEESMEVCAREWERGRTLRGVRGVSWAWWSRVERMKTQGETPRCRLGEVVRGQPLPALQGNEVLGVCRHLVENVEILRAVV